MTLETIYFLSGIVAAAGVIASLVFVGLQMRQNTKAIRLASATNYQSSLGDLEFFIAREAEFADLLEKGRTGQALTPTEELRLSVFYSNVLRIWQNLHVQYVEGVLEPELWQGFRTGLERIIEQDDGLYRSWTLSKPLLTQAFNDLVSEIAVGLGRQP
jgi:hypothetical protein